MPDDLPGSVLPIPDQPYAGPIVFDAKKLDEKLPPLVVEAAAGAGAQRADRAARRRRLRRVQRVRRSRHDADGRAPGRRRAALHAASTPRRSARRRARRCSPAATTTRSAWARSPRRRRRRRATARPARTRACRCPRSSASPATTRPSSASATRCRCGSPGPTGPFDHWPAFSGFEKFYGFIGGETNQWTPALIDGVSLIEPPDDPDYHLMPDLADQAIALRQPAEGADARQAVLRLLRAGRDPRPAPRAEGLDRQVRGPVRPGLGRAARGDVRPPEGARRDPRRRRAHRALRRASRRGTTCPPSSSRSSPTRWRSTRRSSSTPTTTPVA